jgi:hypothetical protein
VANTPRRTRHIYNPNPIARTAFAPSDEPPK